MSVTQQIHACLEKLKPTHLSVENESSQHNVPAGSESHFRVVVVTSAFENTSRIARHRQVNQLLDALLKGPIHALALHAFTPDEWEQREAAKSPPCLGGSKGDKGNG